MAPARTFRDLGVWQKSHALVLDKARHMNIAQGSLEELQYYFILCVDLSYLPREPVGDRLNEVARMLGSYTQQILDSRS
jgi:four helix bundle protein